jgi:hypothetical protein
MTAVLRRAIWIACLVLASPAASPAQEPLTPAPSTPEFLSRFDFHLTAAALVADDERFSWDTHWGGDLDILDYVAGRLTIFADYQAVLGDQFQPFDPNQGNYTLAVSSSVRAGDTEIAGVFHHVSRHLGDRPKTFGIALNAVLGRVMRRFGEGDVTLDARVDAGRVINRAYFDYTWMSTGELTLRRRVSPRVQVYGRGRGDAYTVDPAIARRKGQQGGRVEAGVRLSGRGGGLDLYGGFEQVVDADPLDRETRRWVFAGFRLVN